MSPGITGGTGLPLPASDNSADLAHRLQAVETELALLRDELAETNQGVVALYAELDDKAEQLRNASELKSRFLSYMSHEFRTPLGAIRSITRILLDELDGPVTTEQARQINFIQTSVIELSEMVSDQLDLAKIEAGRITISPVWFGMVDLFSALRGMFKPILVNDEVSLLFEESTDIPAIYSDDKKLAQILRNFISNALKFTLRGQIVVRARIEDHETIVFSVTDTGIGISAGHLQHIFEDFVQVESSIQRKFRGTGLGLALSRKLAHLLGGDTFVESSMGHGSTFSVRIPLALPVVRSATLAVVANAG
jgi:signal transduction histidine kinase